jgi:hypothetical protein
VTVAKHQRRTLLIRLLARLGWQRDPGLWAVRCRDQQGRRARLLLTVTSAGVAIVSSSPELVELTPLEVGRLRAALRDALLSFARLSGPETVRVSAGTRRSEPSSPPASPPVPRQRIHLDRLIRPSVAEIATRLAAPPMRDLEG